MAADLLHSPADILRQLVVDLGLGTEPGVKSAWPVYSTSEPDSPDNVVTIYNTTGIYQGRSMIDGETLEQEGFQLRVRAVDHPTGWAKIRAIRVALSHDVYQRQVMVSSQSYLVQCVTRLGVVIDLGKEVPLARRNLFTFNAMLTVRAA